MTVRFLIRLICLTFVVGPLIPAASAPAQILAVWAAGSGDWGDLVQWNTADVPDNNGSDFYNVVIDGDAGSASAVTIQSGNHYAVDSVTIDVGDQLVISANSSLRIDQDISRPQSGNIFNSGTISMNTGAGFTSLFVENNVTLSGNGSIFMNGANARIHDATGSADGHLINVDNHIQGQGSIGLNRMRLTNQAGGLINANVNGTTLVLDTRDDATSVNAGLMSAVNGATLELSNMTDFDNTGGTIQALNNSFVHFTNGTVVTGGTLQRGGLGELLVPSFETATLRDLQINGFMRVQNNANLALDGNIDNRADLLVDGGVSGAADIQIQGTTNLSGVGRITLSGASARLLQEGNGNGHLLNSQLIEGQGLISSLRLSNQAGGVIDANVNGQVLRITQLKGFFDLVNQGVMRASNGGILQIDDVVNGTGVMQNGGAEIQAMDGSVVRMGTGLDIRGGTLRAAGTGRFEVAAFSSGALTDVILDGPMFVDSANLLLFGGIDNRNITSVGTNGRIWVSAPVTLTGGGSIELNEASSRMENDNANAGHLFNVNNTIQGQGVLRTRITNQSGGLIDANINGGTLLLQSADGIDIINDGIMQASNGGWLSIDGVPNGNGVLQNGNGIIQALDGSTVEFRTGFEAVGGTIRTSGSGQLATADFATVRLNDLTIDGPFSVNTGASVFLNGNINHLQETTLDGTTSNTRLKITGNTTLSGGGTITMNGPGSVIERGSFQGPGVGNLINVDNLIQGEGKIFDGVIITNQAGGLIDANVNGATLFLNSAGGFDQINQGILQASAGGILQIAGIANGSGSLDNNGGGVVQALDGSVVQFTNGLRVIGGTLRTAGTGEFQVTANNQFRFADLTIDGLVRVIDNASLFLDGNITNMGNTIVVDGANSSSAIQITGDATLDGGGTIRLLGPDAKIVRGGFQGQAVGNLVNVDNTIEGQGLLGDGIVILTNQAAGLIQANVAGATLTMNARNEIPGIVTATNNGTFRATNGGTLLMVGTNGGEYAGAGTFEALDNSALQFDATAVVQNFDAGGNLTAGNWRAIDQGLGATLAVDNPATAAVTSIGSLATVELSGANSGFTIGPTALDDSILGNQGNLILRNGRVMNTSSSFSNSGNVLVDGSATQLNVFDEYGQTAGETRLVEGALLSGASVEFSGGLLAGNGTVDGPAQFDPLATIAPGESAGILLFDDVTVMGGTLELELGGIQIDGLNPNAAVVNSSTDFENIDFDQVNILGAGQLLDGSTLDISFLSGFTPDVGDFFDVLTGDTLTVGNLNIVAPDGFGFSWGVLNLSDATFGGNRDVLRLNVVAGVPEPGSGLLLLLALMMPGIHRRRRQGRITE